MEQNNKKKQKNILKGGKILYTVCSIAHYPQIFFFQKKTQKTPLTDVQQKQRNSCLH